MKKFEFLTINGPPGFTSPHYFISFLKRIVLFLTFLPLSYFSYSQSLIKPISSVGVLWFPKHHECIIVDIEDNVIEGKIVSGIGAGTSIKSIAVKGKDGVKAKMKASHIKSMKVKASDLIKYDMAIDGDVSIIKIATANWEEIAETEYLFFEQAIQPKKKGKIRLFLLLNPGFDSKIKVYDDPFAQETSENSIGGIQVSGGEKKSYLFVKNHEKPIKVKKSDYKNQFIQLYGDCPEMMETFTIEKDMFKDLAVHVFTYDQVCK